MIANMTLCMRWRDGHYVLYTNIQVRAFLSSLEISALELRL